MQSRTKESEIIKRTGYFPKQGEWFEQDANGEIVIKRETTDRDVTTECSVQLVPSTVSKGYYVLLLHKDKRIAAIGLSELFRSYPMVPGKGNYKLVKAERAAVSFRVIQVKQDR